MECNFDDLVQQAVEQIPESPEKKLLADALKTSMENSEAGIERLLMAKSTGDLNEQEFDLEFEREKKMVEAEMLTWEVATKAEVEKIVTKTFYLFRAV